MNVLSNDLKTLIEEEQKRKIDDRNKDQWQLGYHLMPIMGWLNDPNGLCQFKDEYHVFYQYSPLEVNGGLKYWGHYVSKDFINWERRDIALYPDSKYDCHGVYSGSVMIEDDTMYIYYTGNVKHTGNHDYILTGREQNTIMVESKDGKVFSNKKLLMTNEDYLNNMTKHVRDPKVWKQKNIYYMILGARDKENIGQALIYKSLDKEKWEFERKLCSKKSLGYMWECPDIFNIGNKKVLMISPQGIEKEGYKYNNVYQSGYMFISGINNNELDEFRELDRGFDFYAPQSFEDSKGRRIIIGWMGLPDIPYTNPTINKGWQHCLTLPRELKIINNKIYQFPLDEYKQLRNNKRIFIINEGLNIECNNRVFESVVNFEGKINELAIDLRKDVNITYKNRILSLNLGKSGYGRLNRSVKLRELKSIRIFSDNSSLEIFVNDGEEVFTTRVYDEKIDKRLVIKKCNARGILELYDLNNINIEIAN